MGIPLIDEPIIRAQLGLMDRMMKRAQNDDERKAKIHRATPTRHDNVTTVLTAGS